jgi:twitching motility protein PilT
MVALLESILRCLTDMSGDAVLLHALEAPVVLTARGQSPMPFSPLTREQMDAIVAELVPASVRPQLERDGAAHYTLPAARDREPVAVTAIGKGGDVWLELRWSVAEPAAAVAPARPVADTASSRPQQRISNLDELTALIARAAAVGESVLFLQSGAVPALKANGTVQWLDDFEPLDEEALARTLQALSAQVGPGLDRDAPLRWTMTDAIVDCRLASASPRVEAAFFVTPRQPVPAERLGIPAAVRDLCRHDSGLVIVAGADAKRTSRTCHSLIDLINRECAHHIIVVEGDAITSHARQAGYLSHRIVCGDADASVRALTEALVQQPDVLMTDCVPSWQSLELLLAHASETLVIVTVQAPSAIAALETLTAGVPPERRASLCGRVAESVAAVLGQREISGRRAGAAVSAYELILASASVRDLIRRDAFESLAIALERGTDGMISMAAAVSGLMRQGRISRRQAALAVPGLALPAPSEAPARVEPAAQPREEIGEPIDLSDALAGLLSDGGDA